MTLVRTPEALKVARAALGLSADALARIVRVEDGRTVRRWEAAEREIPGPVIVILETAMGYLDSIKLIDTQLETMRSGKMRTGETTLAGRVDQTAADIERLTDHRKSLVDALEILTRQPADDGSNCVHWYTLKRSTPCAVRWPRRVDSTRRVEPRGGARLFRKTWGF